MTVHTLVEDLKVGDIIAHHGVVYEVTANIAPAGYGEPGTSAVHQINAISEDDGSDYSLLLSRWYGLDVLNN